MNTEKEQFLAFSKKQMGGKQVLVECVINLENGEQIDKVLSLGVDCRIKNNEIFEKEAKFGGEIFATLLYLTPSGEIGSVASTCPFQDVYKNDLFDPQNKVFALSKVVSVNPSSSYEGTFKMVVTIEVSFTENANFNVDSYYSSEDNCCSKLATQNFNVLKNETNNQFNVESKIQIKENVTKILSVECSVILKETNVASGYVSLQGEVCSQISYLKDDGVVSQAQLIENFKQEVESGSGDSMEVNLFVKKSEVKATIETEGEKSNVVIITSPLETIIRSYSVEEVPITTDVYSLSNEIEIQKGSFLNSKTLQSKYFESKVEGGLTLPENSPRIDKVLLLSSPRLTISNSYSKEEEIFVEGLIRANVVYLNDESSQINSVEIEVPFVSSEKIALENEVKVETFAIITDCDILAKKGRELYFDCKIKVYVNMWQDENFEFISSVTNGKPLPEKDSAIEIFFASQGLTFWDIAKELKVNEETLQKQNPTLISPLERDERVVVYYGIE